MDWPEFFKALGYAVAAIIGALGLWAFRLIPVKARAGIDTREAEAKIEKDKATADRKARKEAIDEYRELLEVQRRDAEDWRKQVHEVRGENQRLSSELAVCKFHLTELQRRVDECEQDRREMADVPEGERQAYISRKIIQIRREHFPGPPDDD